MTRTVRGRKQQRTLTKKKSQAAADEQPKTKGDSPGRKANGQFARGNPGGPGNPHARFSAHMLTIARQTMTPEKIAAVFEAIYFRAVSGDMSAAKLILHYTIGKPGDAPHPDHLERDEWDLYQKNAMTFAEMQQALGGLPCSLGNEIVGAALPAMTAARAEELAAKLRDEGTGTKDEPKGRRRVRALKGTQSQANSPVDPWDVDSAPPLTNRKAESAPAPVSPATRHQPATTPSFSLSTRHQSLATNSSPPLTNRKTEGAKTTGNRGRQVASPASPATNRSPLTIGVSDGLVGSKKGRKLVAKQWLQPLAKKLNGANQKSKKRPHTRA